MTRKYRVKNFKFCSITTLPLATRQRIYNHMSYKGGGMHRLIHRNTKRVRVCLVYHRRRLVAWVALELDRTTVGWKEYNRPSVIAWTDRKYRSRGCASAGIRELLKRHRSQLKPNTTITVYHPKIEAVVKDCGYRPRLVEWP